jgi:hypothetical protein
MLVFLVGLVGLAGCNSPTLPLPPPSEPAISAVDAQGYVTLSAGQGGAIPGALVYALNKRTGDGSFTTATDAGSYEMKIQAKRFDLLAVWQERNLTESDYLLVEVK